MKAFILFCLLTLFTTESISEQLHECWPLKLTTVCKQLSLQCSDSKQCKSEEICCRHDCGTVCLNSERIGQKPDIQKLNNCWNFKPEFNCFQYNKECNSNFDCQANHFCCQYECGTQCKDSFIEQELKYSVYSLKEESFTNPDPPKPSCPPPVTGIRCTGTAITNTCAVNSDCKGNTKICCINMCGSSCH